MIVKVKGPSQYICEKAPNTRKTLPQLIKRGGKGEFMREVPKKGVFSLIINLTRTSENVSRQPVRTSFVGEEKETTLSIDSTMIPGRHVTSRGSRHQQTQSSSFLSGYNFKLYVKRNFDMVDIVQLYIEIPWFIR